MQNKEDYGRKNAFFYIYENDARTTNANRVKLTFKVVNTTLLNIQTTYTYNTSLSGDNNGKFTRNKGYFVTAKVNKLINILSLSDHPMVAPNLNIGKYMATNTY